VDVEKKDIITVFNQVRWINMKKKNLLILIVVAALIVIIAGIMIYTFIFKDKEENIEFAESLPSSQDQDVVTEEIIAYDTWVNLSDKVDSDSDGLTDYEETEIYGTDPKNKDSDGDGFSDGDEVKKWLQSFG